MEPLKIGFLSSEVHPFSKTGGLADVSAALPRFLSGRGHDVRVFTPLYGRIDRRRYQFEPIGTLRHVPVRFGAQVQTFSVLVSSLPGSDLKIYFLDCPALYGREAIYTRDPDESIRFALLSRAALEISQRLGWSPDVFHCHDWHAGLLPIYLRTLYAWDALFRRTKTILTIHNIGYQGVFSAEILPVLGLSESAHLFHNEDLRSGVINYLKTGILYADVLTTVSRTYAEEIQTEDFGAGLHDLLRERRRALVGIVNGVDYSEWDPSRDPFIPHRYSPRSLATKGKNKKALLETMGMVHDPRSAVLGIISRLTVQKGFELLFDTMPSQLAHKNIRLAVLGTGEPRLEQFFRRLQSAFPGKVSFYRGFSNELAHLIEAGSDIFLMPSRYEPCGLNQMYSLRYGTVPLVRKTGGLADTVQLYDPSTGEGTGFVFDHFTADALRWALNAAIEIYEDRRTWKRLMLNGMAQDFSWDVQGQRYIDLYANVTGRG